MSAGWSPDGWEPRSTPRGLASRYRHEGYWVDETLGQLLEGCLARHAALTFRVWSDRRPYEGTVGDVHHVARRLASALHDRGVGPGDVVAFQLPNWMEAAAVFWGVSLLGAVLVPVVHFYGPKEVGFILEQSGARALVTADRFGRLDFLEGLEAIWPGLDRLETVLVVGDSRALPGRAVSFGSALASDPLPAAVPSDPMAPALVAYTSGTTSEPKGVIHSHLTLGAELRQGAEMWSSEERPTLMGAPVGHAIGMLGGLLGPVYRGRAIHLADAWNPPAILDAMVEADLAFSGGATYFLTSLLDAPNFTARHLRHIRHAGLGGSPVPPSVSDRARSLGISIIRSYGSTEHPSITGATHDEPEAKRLYTDGHPMGGVDLRVLRDDGSEVGPGEPGAISSRGPELFVGYTDPDLTAAAFDTGGWYRTGDVGVLDADGFLTITDRTQDIIIRGGENISAGEVEEVLLRLHGIAEAVVVAAPDDRLGEHGCAFLRLQPGVEPPDLAAVRRHLEAAGLARQKWPEELRVVENFPRTPSSKVKKFVLRDELRAEHRRHPAREPRSHS